MRCTPLRRGRVGVHGGSSERVAERERPPAPARAAGAGGGARAGPAGAAGGGVAPAAPLLWPAATAVALPSAAGALQSPPVAPGPIVRRVVGDGEPSTTISVPAMSFRVM